MKKITLLLALYQLASASNFGLQITAFGGGQMAKIEDKTKATAYTVLHAHNLNRVKTHEGAHKNTPANPALFKEADFARDYNMEDKCITGGAAIQAKLLDLDSIQLGLFASVGMANFCACSKHVSVERTGLDNIAGAYVKYAITSNIKAGVAIGGTVISAEHKITMPDLTKHAKKIHDAHDQAHEKELKAMSCKVFASKSENNVGSTVAIFGEYAINETVSVSAIVRVTKAKLKFDTSKVEHAKVVFNNNEADVLIAQAAIGATVNVL